jgi:hypothetical protein
LLAKGWPVAEESAEELFKGILPAEGTWTGQREGQ